MILNRRVLSLQIDEEVLLSYNGNRPERWPQGWKRGKRESDEPKWLTFYLSLPWRKEWRKGAKSSGAVL